MLLILLFKFTTSFQIVNHDTNIGDNPHTAILYGNLTFGYYYVNIYVGENLTKHSLVVDTGSSTNTFYCNQCTTCGLHQNPPYQYQGNKSDRSILKDYFNCTQTSDNKCRFKQGYVEGSQISGFYYLDKVLFGDGLYQLEDEVTNQEKFDAILGCTTYETGQLASQFADGILGLSPNTNTLQNPPSLIDLIVKKEEAKNMKRSLSICLGENNGYMSIGKYNTFRHEKNSTIQTISFSATSFYSVSLKEISFGNIKVDIDNGQYSTGQGTFLDSGATMSYADSKIITAITKAVQEYVTNNNSNQQFKKKGGSQTCFMKDKKINKTKFFSQFPSFYFTFLGNVSIEWLPSNYLFFDNAAYCIGILPLANRVILGQNWMRGRDILFDLQDHQISFINANCSITKFNISIQEQKKEELNESQQLTKPEQEVYEELISEEFQAEETDDAHSIENMRQPSYITNYLYEKANNILEETQELSWLRIGLYIIILILIIKGIIFFGLYVMKKCGGNLYQYIAKDKKFQPLDNTANNANEQQENTGFIELEIQESKIIV